MPFIGIVDPPPSPNLTLTKDLSIGRQSYPQNYPSVLILNENLDRFGGDLENHTFSPADSYRLNVTKGPDADLNSFGLSGLSIFSRVELEAGMITDVVSQLSQYTKRVVDIYVPQITSINPISEGVALDCEKHPNGLSAPQMNSLYTQTQSNLRSLSTPVETANCTCFVSILPSLEQLVDSFNTIKKRCTHYPKNSLDTNSIRPSDSYPRFSKAKKADLPTCLTRPTGSANSLLSPSTTFTPGDSSICISANSFANFSHCEFQRYQQHPSFPSNGNLSHLDFCNSLHDIPHSELSNPYTLRSTNYHSEANSAFSRRSKNFATIVDSFRDLDTELDELSSEARGFVILILSSFLFMPI
ncbi:unnamed protein product [Protopolystoma xenopodis]|uniref:Uncharacterized protein n=1 Tax=Protopolystoma xenopodis TaxID=117903 RepID=A0A3S5BWN1_9PLAT|nr:unnamed protein product [Protopolystoma xenopodis]